LADIVTKTEKALLLLSAVAVLLVAALGLWPERALESKPVYRESPAAPEEPVQDALWLDIRQSVDLNHATVKELEALPGIGEKLARRIVAYRSIHGPFHRVEELMKVEGIRESTLEAILAQTELRE
jgi:competence protein ComEA